jgi:hypothetical protein
MNKNANDKLKTWMEHEDKPIRLMTISVEDWEQQKKWAELGKLAVEAIDRFDDDDVETYPCEDFKLNYDECNIDGCSCDWFEFCQKRKELEGVDNAKS